MAQTIGELAIKIIATTGDFDKKISQMGKAGAAAQGQFVGLARTIDTTFKVAIAGATAAIGAFVASSAMIGAAFEKEIAIIGSIRGVSKATAEGRAELEAFELKARELGASTAYSATEAAQGMQQLARAGFSTNQVIAAIGPSLQFAGASASDMESATSLLAASMKQFGLTSSEASRITDAFTVIQQKSLFDMESLTNAMRYAGTVGASFGMSLEKTTAAVALFRDLGLQGASAGVQFRMAMMRLGKPTAAAEKVLEKYNITLDEVNPSLNDFDTIARRLAKANIAFPDLTTLFSSRAAGSMSQIIEQFAEGRSKYDEFIGAIEDGGGATARTYDATLENLSGFTDIAKSAFQELQLTIFDTFSGPLMQLVGGEGGSGGITGLLNEISSGVQLVSDQISANIGDSLGGLYDTINSNQTQIAAGIAVFVENVVSAITKFIEWLPIIIEVGRVLLTIWAVAKLQAFISATASVIAAVLSLIPAFGGAAVAAEGFAAALALTNPVGWAVLLGVATAALVAFAFGTSDAEERQRQYARQMDASKEAIKRFRDEQKQATDQQVANKNAIFGSIRTELLERGKLTAEIKNELDNVQRLTDTQLAEAQSRGEVFKTVINGTEALISHKAAFLLAAQGGEEYQYVLEDQKKALEDVDASRANEMGKLDRLVGLNQDLAKTAKKVESGQYSLFRANLVAGGQISAYSDVLSSVEREQYNLADAQNATFVEMSKLTPIVSELSKQYDGMSASIKEAEAATEEIINAADIKRQRKDQREREANAKRNAEAAKQRAEQYRDLMKKLEDLTQSNYDKLEALDDDYSDAVARKGNDRVKAIKQEYKEIFELAKRNRTKMIKAEAEMARAIAAQRRLSSAQFEKEYESSTNALISRANARSQSEIQAIDDRLQEELNLEEERIEARQTLLGDEIMARLDLADKEAAEVRELFKKDAEGLANAMEVITQDRLAAEQEFKDEQAKIVEDGEVNLQRIRDEFGTQRKEKEDELGQEIETIVAGTAQRSAMAELVARQSIEREIFTAKIRGATDAAAQLRAFDAAQAQQRLTLEQQTINALVNQAGQYSDRVIAIDEKLVGKREGRSRDRLEQERAYLVERAALEQEYADVAVEVAELSAEQQAQALGIVETKLKALDAANRRFTVRSFIEGFKSIGKAIKGGETGIQKFFKVLKNDGAGAAFSSLTSGFGNLKDMILDIDLGAVFEDIGMAAVGMARLAVKGLGAIASGVSSVVSAAGDALNFMTGGANLNPMALISEGGAAITAAQEEGAAERAELDQQLESGDISQEEYDKAIAAGVGEVDATQIGADFVQGVVDNAINMIQAIAAGAPAILQRLATEIPILIDALVVAIPQLIETLATQLPVVVFALVDGIIALLPNLVGSLVENLPILVDGIITLLTVKLPELLSTLTPLVVDIVALLVSEVPRIVDALVAALPDVVSFVVGAVEAILTGIPTIIESILGAIPTILTELLGGIGDIILAVFDAIPIIIDKIILALPDIIMALIRGVLGALVKIAEALPILIASLIKALPTLLTALLDLIPEILFAIIELIPLIIESLILALPEIITALITLIPELIFAIILALPKIASALVIAIIDLLIVSLPRLVMALATALVDAIASGIQGLIQSIEDFFDAIPQVFADIGEWFRGLPERIAEGFMEGLNKFVQFFRDVISEITSLGRTETATFGDTPYAIRAGMDGLTANFAPQDYIIASQTKRGLLKQAVEAMSGGMGQSAPDFIPANNPTGGSSTINLAVAADGRLLDQITVTALNDGRAPRLEKKLNRASGARVGFDRGRFNIYSR